MPRIAGVNIPEKKRIEIALTYIFGIGPKTAEKILNDSGIDSNIRAHELSDEQINSIRGVIEKTFTVEGDLKQEKMRNIKRLREIGSYRGKRHSKGLPSRGQRTKTNSRTVRGNVRRTAGSGRRDASQKT